MTLTVPVNGKSVPFFVAGKFGRPSVNNGDVKIEARVGAALVGSVQVTVRVRKNDNTLTAGERNRFVAVFAGSTTRAWVVSRISAVCIRT